MAEQIRVVLTGPESTAKSTLAKELAAYFNGTFYPEYAREYFREHSTEYSYEDLELITRKQLEQYQHSKRGKTEIVFFDTWLIITKIWFQWVFKKEPHWLEDEISNLPIDLYLLCLPDIPWEADPLREHGGEDRVKLFHHYKQELVKRKLRYVEIGGIGEKRIQNAIRAVLNFIEA
jgi:NadR type nicotinamide-nucleotide adenylyltransferase